MDNFLTLLFFEKFKLNQKEQQLMNNNEWEDSENGRISCARNDQSISETRQQSKMIEHLIKNYIEKIKQE